MYKYLDRFNFLSKYYQRCHLFEYTCDDKTFQSIFDLSKLGSASVWMPGDVVAQRHVQGRHIVKLFVYGGEERYYETDRHGLVLYVSYKSFSGKTATTVQVVLYD
jgi:hypothetical protein